MKKKSLKNLDIDVYSEKLENNLEIFLIPLKDMKRYFITYATKYGSLITEFTPNGSKKQVKVPNGVAHFLEHKMFEQESGEDPFEFFSKSGTYVNASTSFQSTRYICSGTTNYEENLKYLLNFVNHPYFTDSNVEKEKGIIIEELNMYKDDPESALDDTCRKNLFKIDPYRIDVGGDVSDVRQITKEDLYLCYDNFYSPQNMFVLIVGNIDVNNTLKILKEQLGTLKNKYKSLPKVKKYNEPYEVNKEREIVKFNVEIPKLSYSLKLRRKDFKIKDDFILDSYINIILKTLFGSTSLFRENGKQKDLFTYFSYSFDFTNDYVIINLCSETEQCDKLIDEIDEVLKNRNNILNEDDFNRAIKVYIAHKIKDSCYIDSISSNIYADIINYNRIIYNKIDVVRDLDYKTMIEVSNCIDINNKSVVCYVPNDER